MTLLQVSDLRVGGSAGPLVGPVDLTVAPGERVALIGASGAGKSLTVNALLTLHTGTAETPLPVTGSLTLRAPGHERALGAVFQESALALDPLTRVRRQLELPLRAARTPRTERQQRVAGLLKRLGIDGNARPLELSGGQRQRAALGLALIRPPALLLADEPTSALDVLTQRAILEVLDTELGHLILHGGVPSGEAQLEREADTFAAELLTPSETLREELPTRMDFAKLFRLSERWGVEVRSLIYRSQELGLISTSTARRAYIRLVQSPQEHRSIREYDGEVPSLLNSAFELAGTLGITVATLADQLRWTPRRVRQLLGHADDPRPALSPGHSVRQRSSPR